LGDSAALRGGGDPSEDGEDNRSRRWWGLQPQAARTGKASILIGVIGQLGYEMAAFAESALSKTGA